MSEGLELSFYDRHKHGLRLFFSSGILASGMWIVWQAATITQVLNEVVRVQEQHSRILQERGAAVTRLETAVVRIEKLEQEVKHLQEYNDRQIDAWRGRKPPEDAR